MNPILLLMPNHTYRAGAFLQAAEQLGVPVVVGSPQTHVLSALNPQGFLQLDFQDLEGATDAIVNFARRQPLSAVLSPDDDGLVLAAMASDALQLSHNRVTAVATARNKLAMREALAGAGLPSPWFAGFPVASDPAEIAEEVPYPNVLKPLALSASRGVIRADDPPQFESAFRRVAALLAEPAVEAELGPLAQHLLVEGYIPGEEVALEGLMIQGELQTLALFDKPDPLEGPYFEETLYITPSRHPQGIQRAVVSATQSAALALEIRDGPVHAELRLNPQGIWLVEVAPRTIGGHCSRALRFTQGRAAGTIGLENLVLQHALGREVGSTRREPAASGVMMIPTPNAGQLAAVHGRQAASNVPAVDEVLITVPTGQNLVPLPEGNQYLGFIFARAATPTVVENALREAHGCLQFDII